MGVPQFSYGLFPDTAVWDAWVFAVEDEAYGATQPEIDAVQKFSDYVIKVECETNGDYDGCCMLSTAPDYGGWCLFQAGSKMDTYRLKLEDSKDFIESAFIGVGTDYELALYNGGLRVETANPENVDYLHFFHCGSKVNDVFTCYHF